jgi:SlyX protein
MPVSLEERLTELETKLAFVDDTLGTLNDAVAAQDRRLHDLRNALDRLRHELLAMRGALAHDAADEPPPPHY